MVELIVISIQVDNTAIETSMQLGMSVISLRQIFATICLRIASKTITFKH